LPDDDAARFGELQEMREQILAASTRPQPSLAIDDGFQRRRGHRPEGV
jgi:hypothetical protein